MAHEPQPFLEISSLHMCIQSCKSGDLAAVQFWYEDCCDDTERSALLTPEFILDLLNKHRNKVVSYLWLQMDETAKIDVFKEACLTKDKDAIECCYYECSEEEKNRVICAICFAGYFEAAHYLAGEGFDSEKVGETLKTYSWEHLDDAQRNHLFRLACREGWVDLVRMLWNKMSVDGINEKDAHGYTALDHAFESKCVELIEFLLSQKEVKLNDINSDGSNALHIASSKGLLGIVKLLCEQKSLEIDAVNLQGNSAILLASKKGHLATVRYLFETSKANIHLKDSEGLDAFTHAFQKHHFFVVKYLCENVDTFDSDTFLNFVKLIGGEGSRDICAVLYFFAALSHLRHSRNDEAVVCLEESYKQSFKVFRELLAGFIVNQHKKGYCLEEKAYYQFLLSVLEMLQNKDSQDIPVLYLDCGQMFLQTFNRCKDTEGKKTILYRSMLFFSQLPDIKSSEIQHEFATCFQLLLELKFEKNIEVTGGFGSNFDFLVKNYLKDIVEIINHIVEYFSLKEFKRAQLDGLIKLSGSGSICEQGYSSLEVKAHELCEENVRLTRELEKEKKNKKRGRSEEDKEGEEETFWESDDDAEEESDERFYRNKKPGRSEEDEEAEEPNKLLDGEPSTPKRAEGTFLLPKGRLLPLVSDENNNSTDGNSPRKGEILREPRSGRK